MYEELSCWSDRMDRLNSQKHLVVNVEKIIWDISKPILRKLKQTQTYGEALWWGSIVTGY